MATAHFDRRGFIRSDAGCHASSIPGQSLMGTQTLLAPQIRKNYSVPMNCPGCGSPLEKGAQFCPKCYDRIEPPGLWRRFLSLFQTTGTPARRIMDIKKTVTIKTTDPDGQHHEYHSMAEAPPEVRAELEKLEAEALKRASDSVISEESDGISTIISKKSLSVFKIKDASGNERVYHSLDELPPEIRAAFERAQEKEE